jgi:hypothetical protein
MRHLLLRVGIGWLAVTTAFSQGTATRSHLHRHTRTRPSVATVLICGSRSAYAYHSYECHGLARCRSGVSRVTVSEARSMGYVPCKICY